MIRESFAEAFREKFEPRLAGRIETEYVFQELTSYVPDPSRISPDRQKPWGTGHAVLVARDVIREPFVVINADDFYGPRSYRMLNDYLSQAGPADYCMVGYRLDRTLSEHGSVSRGVCQTDGDGFLKTVVEKTHIEKKGGQIVSAIDENSTETLTGAEVVSMNIWGFMPSFFDHLESHFAEFIDAQAGNPKGEFYIPFVVNSLISRGQVRLKVLESADAWFGITYKDDKELAIKSINGLIQQKVYPVDL